MRRAAWFAAIVCVTAASGAQASDYLRVQFLPEKQAALFLQFDEDALRVATTTGGLATAQPIRADEVSPMPGEGGTSLADYRRVTLPARPQGASRATASFRVEHFKPKATAPHAVPENTYVSGSFSISIPGAAGGSWTYVAAASSATLDRERAASPAEAPVLVIGDLSHPVLTIEPQVTGRKVAIAVRLWTGEPAKAIDAESGRAILAPLDTATSIGSVERNGRPARVHLDVVAPPGKTVKSAEGDLSTFGLRGGRAHYSVPVAKKGSYTVRAAMQAPKGPVAAKATFPVR
jgi:hypothetical protein